MNEQPRPLAHVAMETLISVVNRGRYARYGQEFEDALQYELQARATEAKWTPYSCS